MKDKILKNPYGPNRRNPTKDIKECRSIYLGSSDWQLLDNIAEEKKYPGPTKVIRDMIQDMRSKVLVSDNL